MHLVDNQLNL